MKNLLVTGGYGFIARRLIPLLVSSGWLVRATVRDQEDLGVLPPGAQGIVTGDLAAMKNLGPLLEGVQVVVHLAARVHRMDENGPEAEAAYERDNAELTRSLAEVAAAAGVRRFVLASSIKAMGESTPPGTRWDESAPCLPEDAYGRSKRRAEEALWAVAARGRLEGVVLRAPLVYGPGVKANMARLFRVVERGLPLPLACVRNARSFVFVDNLVSAVSHCLSHPKAAGETFLVSDGEDLSTPDLVRRIGRSLGRPARLLPVPAFLLRAGAALAGRSQEAGRLLDSLAVDSAKLRRTLGWKPPFTVDEGLARTAEGLRP